MARTTSSDRLAVPIESEAPTEFAAGNRIAKFIEVDRIRNQADGLRTNAEILKLPALCVGNSDDARRAGENAVAEHDVEQTFRQAAALDDRRGAVGCEDVWYARCAEVMGRNRARHVSARVHVRDVEARGVPLEKF